MIVSADLKKRNQTWELFLPELSNSHINPSLVNEAEVSPDPSDKVSSVNVNTDQNSVRIQDCGSPSHGKKQ